MASFSFGHGAAAQSNAGSFEGAGSSDVPREVFENGPGWYDSSWDLQRGLIVCEGLPRDASLHEWLQHELHGAPDQAAWSVV